MAKVDYKKERENDITTIKNSTHPRKVVVGGPGTGKSYLFSELIKNKLSKGKTNFLAITFIGKLRDVLADDLCGLAKTTTMHSFARSFILQQYEGWNYHPRMYELISEDLKAEGVETFKIGDENYIQKTKYYQAVGDDDVVHYAVRICKKYPNKIPVYDLILVDEYQDFSLIESEFVDLLAQKNNIVIVGDDDQSLYGFRGSSPFFIRKKYDLKNIHWESYTLRFCSRCTEIMIKYFHTLVERFNLNNPVESDPAKKRIKKEYICYAPDGERDSKIYDSRANPQIHLIKNCPVGMIAYKIKNELEKLVENQKVKEILVIGEGQSCEALLKKIAQQLKNYGFKNVDYRGRDDGCVLRFRQAIIDAYKFIAKDESSLLGWRILGNIANQEEKEQHVRNAKTLIAIIDGTPSKLKKIKEEDIRILEATIENWGDESDETATEAERNKQNEEIRKGVLIQDLKRSNLHLSRPLCNLDIAVCNILNSKGLNADIVFIIGFDQGKFPSKVNATDSEIYQMLVATTRAKKRVYLINTIKSKVSGFVDCLNVADLNIEEIKTQCRK